MNLQRFFIIASIVVAVLLFGRWQDRPIEHPPGVLVEEVPQQRTVAADAFVKKDFVLTQRASFELRARLLAKQEYSLDEGASLAPVDFALGWGPMSDQSNLDQLTIRQSGRWYFLSWNGAPPIDEDVMMEHSGNMHIIPANDLVASTLDELRPGHLLRLQGYLVEASRSDGFKWNTSLSRTDVGSGSCELFYVETLFFE